MGFTYLEGKSWTEITREERFFTQRLYELIKKDQKLFLEFIKSKFLKDLDVGGEWETGYEVCFYRDLYKMDPEIFSKCKGVKCYSPKRTFDLALFGKKDIVIIEAKAATDFESEQNDNFIRDVKWVKNLTGVQNVHLVALYSSKCNQRDEIKKVFDENQITWEELTGLYPGEAVLKRADEIYEPNLHPHGKNSDGSFDGLFLYESNVPKENLWVGRGGGLHGDRFKKDVETGNWKRYRYEVNTTSKVPPSPNYFSLTDFIEAIKKSQKS